MPQTSQYHNMALTSYDARVQDDGQGRLHFSTLSDKREPPTFSRSLDSGRGPSVVDEHAHVISCVEVAIAEGQPAIDRLEMIPALSCSIIWRFLLRQGYPERTPNRRHGLPQADQAHGRAVRRAELFVAGTPNHLSNRRARGEEHASGQGAEAREAGAQVRAMG